MPWTLVGNLTPCVPDWDYEPPPDHLTLPPVNVGDQKLVGVFAVFPQDGANFVALSAAGAYTVNWGDGTTEDFATGVQANHAYTYSSIPSGTTTAGGYRQVIITVTPQAGQTLTAINLGRKHTQVGLNNNGGVGWLDVCMAGASVSSLQLAANTSNAVVVLLTHLERFEYKGPSALTNLTYLFSKCYALRSIKGSQWTSLATTITSMFAECNSLTAVVDLDLSKATSAASLFANLPSLLRVSGVNLSAATSAVSIFSNCTALQEVADLNLSKVATAASMFTTCSALRTVSNVDCSLATAFNSAFGNCASLQSVTGLVTTKGTNFASMFPGCASLRTVGLFDTSQGTNINAMFSGCSSLMALPAFNMAAATSMTNFVGTCASMVDVGVVGLKITCDFSNLRLSSAALDTLYANLGTPATVQTLTVTGNYGTTGDTPSIATAKNWTVTGS